MAADDSRIFLVITVVLADLLVLAVQQSLLLSGAVDIIEEDAEVPTFPKLGLFGGFYNIWEA